MDVYPSAEGELATRTSAPSRNLRIKKARQLDHVTWMTGTSLEADCCMNLGWMGIWHQGGNRVRFRSRLGSTGQGVSSRLGSHLRLGTRVEPVLDASQDDAAAKPRGGTFDFCWLRTCGNLCLPTQRKIGFCKRLGMAPIDKNAREGQRPTLCTNQRVTPSPHWLPMSPKQLPPRFVDVAFTFALLKGRNTADQTCQFGTAPPNMQWWKSVLKGLSRLVRRCQCEVCHMNDCPGFSIEHRLPLSQHS